MASSPCATSPGASRKGEEPASLSTFRLEVEWAQAHTYRQQPDESDHEERLTSHAGLRREKRRVWACGRDVVKTVRTAGHGRAAGDADRAALIGGLHQREDAGWLAELLRDIEADPEGITRLQVVEALRRAL